MLAKGYSAYRIAHRWSNNRSEADTWFYDTVVIEKGLEQAVNSYLKAASDETNDLGKRLSLNYDSTALELRIELVGESAVIPVTLVKKLAKEIGWVKKE